MSAPLPDPKAFDPVAFPGQEEGEEWPPPRFDFSASRLRSPGLVFERDAAGEARLVRDCGTVRFVMPVDTVHVAMDIIPGSRDYRLLRLVPTALRFAERLGADDPVPEVLRGGEPPPVADEQVYAATTALVSALTTQAGSQGRALCDAIRRVPPGQDMFERAVAHCVVEGGQSMENVALLARSLQRLANAHARVLATQSAQPDYLGMEQAVASIHAAMVRDRAWSADLLTHGLGVLAGKITLPRQAVTAILAEATAALGRQGVLANFGRLVAAQDAARDRLLDIAVFWQRLAAAWMAVDLNTTDRREIEALARNSARRLMLAPLYQLGKN
ncbi:hypothetical protein [Roseomonas sp. BN140053]|uniref:hypothetical protein n=1 Tax=Roseomonas sp. BN140053 TaxID=3391898 RepID=UPI0039E97B32